MRRMGLVVVLAVSLVLAPLAGEAEPADKVARLGFLSGSTPSTARGFVEAFRNQLRELGYVEGQNVIIEYRWAEGRFDRFPDLAAELIRLKVDIILATTAAAARAAKEATATHSDRRGWCWRRCRRRARRQSRSARR